MLSSIFCDSWKKSLNQCSGIPGHLSFAKPVCWIPFRFAHSRLLINCHHCVVVDACPVQL